MRNFGSLDVEASKVPLHSRLFAQWMHHLHPREREWGSSSRRCLAWGSSFGMFGEKWQAFQQFFAMNLLGKRCAGVPLSSYVRRGSCTCPFNVSTNGIE